jgi:hypothetical protein
MWQILIAIPRDAENRILRGWAMIYAVIMQDLAETALTLLRDGKHSRAVIMLRRSALEYRTRFTFYRKHPSQAKLAIMEYNEEAEKFAERLGPDDITVFPDPKFDAKAFKKARKTYRDFYYVTTDVFGKKHAPYIYASFYQYPSFLLHGAATASMDVIGEVDSETWQVHRRSRRPYTNELASNLIVFLLDMAVDIAREFRLAVIRELEALGKDFNQTEHRLKVKRLAE